MAGISGCYYSHSVLVHSHAQDDYIGESAKRVIKNPRSQWERYQITCFKRVLKKKTESYTERL